MMSFFPVKRNKNHSYLRHKTNGNILRVNVNWFPLFPCLFFLKLLEKKEKIVLISSFIAFKYCNTREAHFVEIYAFQASVVLGRREPLYITDRHYCTEDYLYSMLRTWQAQQEGKLKVSRRTSPSMLSTTSLWSRYCCLHWVTWPGQDPLHSWWVPSHFPTLTTCWYSVSSSDRSFTMNLHSRSVLRAALGLTKVSRSWQAGCEVSWRTLAWRCVWRCVWRWGLGWEFCWRSDQRGWVLLRTWATSPLSLPLSSRLSLPAWWRSLGTLLDVRTSCHREHTAGIPSISWLSWPGPKRRRGGGPPTLPPSASWLGEESCWELSTARTTDIQLTAWRPHFKANNSQLTTSKVTIFHFISSNSLLTHFQYSWNIEQVLWWM